MIQPALDTSFLRDPDAPRRKFAIAFTEPLLLECYRGTKTLIHRTKTRLLEARYGDILLPIGGNTPLFLTDDPVRRRLQTITHEEALQEGIHAHVIPGDIHERYWPSYRHRLAGHPGYAEPRQAFFAFWDEIQTLYGGTHFAHTNPLVTRIAFSKSDPFQGNLDL